MGALRRPENPEIFGISFSSSLSSRISRNPSSQSSNPGLEVRDDRRRTTPLSGEPKEKPCKERRITMNICMRLNVDTYGIP